MEIEADIAREVGKIDKSLKLRMENVFRSSWPTRVLDRVVNWSGG